MSLALILLNPTLRIEPPTAIEGWVATADGEPVPDARVAAGPLAATSGTDGWYRLAGLAPGPATLTVTHPDHPSRVEHVEIEPGVRRLDWALPAGYRVAGWVVDEDGEPVADAEVTLELLPSDGARSYSERSAGDGAFELTPVAAGRYRLAARAPGYTETELPRTISVDGAGIHDLEVVLTRGIVLGGLLRGPDAEVLATAHVRATGESGSTRRGEIDAAGRYEIADLRAGTWLVEAEVNGGQRHARARVELSPQEREVERDLEFGGGLTLTGQVLFEHAPLPDATVVLRGRELAVERTVKTDGRGKLRFADLESATYRLEVTKASALLVHSETLLVDTDRFVVVELATAAVSGQVVNAVDDDGLAGAVVELRRLPDGSGAGEHLRTSGTGVGGEFVLPRVPPGRYRLSARRAGHAPAAREIAVDAGLDISDLELRLAPSRGLELRIRLASGRVPRTATVHVVDAGGSSLIEESRPLDADGLARFTAVPPSRWRVLVSAPGGAVTAARVEVRGEPADVWLPVAARLIVRVRSLATSDAIAAVRILDAEGRALRALDADGALRRQWPLVGGLAVIEGVPAGVWQVEVTAPDGQTWSDLFHVASGGTEAILE